MPGVGYFEQRSGGLCNYCPQRQGEDYLQNLDLSAANCYKYLGYRCVHRIQLSYIFQLLLLVPRTLLAPCEADMIDVRWRDILSMYFILIPV